LTDDPSTDSKTERLLREIRDLLVPIAGYHQPLYEEIQAKQRSKLKETVQGMLGSPKRRRAWDLADGTRTQRQISQQAPLDEGSTSKLFKALREIGAIVDAPNPTKKVEID
jgi:hypothetical protein